LVNFYFYSIELFKNTSKDNIDYEEIENIYKNFVNLASFVNDKGEVDINVSLSMKEIINLIENIENYSPEEIKILIKNYDEDHNGIYVYF
jgi:Ca2+-binding EF-hand superfamily protein